MASAVASHVASLGLASRLDAKGNLVVAAAGPLKVVVTAHLDEIATMVRSVEADGTLVLAPLGGIFPWKLGEIPLTVMAASGDLDAALSFGSIHTEDASSPAVKAKASGPTWATARGITGLSAAELAAAGVRPGTRVAVHPSARSLVRPGGAGGGAVPRRPGGSRRLASGAGAAGRGAGRGRVRGDGGGGGGGRGGLVVPSGARAGGDGGGAGALAGRSGRAGGFGRASGGVDDGRVRLDVGGGRGARGVAGLRGAVAGALAGGVGRVVRGVARALRAADHAGVADGELARAGGHASGGDGSARRGDGGASASSCAASAPSPPARARRASAAIHAPAIRSMWARSMCPISSQARKCAPASTSDGRARVRACPNTDLPALTLSLSKGAATRLRQASPERK